MPMITNERLSALRTTVRGEFKNAFSTAGAASVYKRISVIIPSGSSSNTYGWLGKFPSMHEWVGKRVLRDMKEFSYEIQNKKYEATMGVDRSDFEDDNLGQYRAISQNMGQECSDFLDRQTALLLKNGFTAKCYDGKNFFDTEHPVYKDAAVKKADEATADKDDVSNIIEDETDTPKTTAEGDEGDGDAEDDGDTAVVEKTPWFLLSLNRPLKPLILQQRTGMELEEITDTKNETVFMEDKYAFGIRWRGNFGYGLWQQAVGAKCDLTAANFEKAYARMMSFKRDGGDPMGMVATALVVPPSLQSDAERIVSVQVLANGAGNINYKKVELIVSAWLS